MSNIHEKVDFSGEPISVGIDVHLKHWNVSLYHGQQYLRKFQQAADPLALISHLNSHYPNAVFRLAYETGFSGFWAQRIFASAGMDCLVVNAADVPQTDKGYRTKNDVTDSRRIAAALSGGLLSSVHIPDQELESDRSVVRYRHRLGRDLTRAKARIKSFLHKFGISIPVELQGSKWPKSFLLWLKSLSLPYPSANLTLKRMIQQVEYFKLQILESSRELRHMIRSERYSQQALLLMSAPGIGALTALTMLTEIGDIGRFDTFYRFNSFIGLCPTEFSSGENQRTGPLTPRKHSMLRSLIIEAAWSAIRLDPAMLMAYNEYKKRMTGKRAIIRIARKMLSRVYYILQKKQSYEKGIVK